MPTQAGVEVDVPAVETHAGDLAGDLGFTLLPLSPPLWHHIIDTLLIHHY